GVGFRLVTPLLAVGVTYIQLLDVSIYLNHYYLVALLAWLLSFAPAHRIWSVDCWLAAVWRRGVAARSSTVSDVAGSQAAAPPTTIAVFWLYLFRVQVGIVYVCAGLAKMQSDWLLHGQPLRIWLGTNTHLPVLGPLF